MRFRDTNTVFMPEVYNNVAGEDFNLGTDIAVSAGMGVQGIDASLAEFASIFGRVTGPQGQPLADIGIRYAFNPYPTSTWPGGSLTKTDDNGFYEVSGLQPGNYRISFTGDSTFISEVYKDVLFLGVDDFNNSQATTISLEAGDHISINESMATWSTISGTVRGPDGTTPLAGIAVTAFETSKWSVANSSTSASNGLYTLGKLLPGTYRVRFADPNGTYVAEMYNDVQVFDPQLGGVDITVPESGSVSYVDAQLALASSSISGTVTGSAPFNSPLAGIVVETFNVTERVLGPSALTDSNGSYMVGGLSPRIYRMRFVSTNGFYIEEVYNNVIGNDFSLGADIELSAGEGVSGINASLDTFSTISGMVKGPDGTTPLAGIVVESAKVSDGVVVSSAITAANGTYNLGGLTGGDYHVRFRDEEGVYIGEVYNNVFGDDFGSGVNINVGTGVGLAGINASLEKRPVVTCVLPQETAGNYQILFTGPTNMDYILQEASSLTSGWADVGSSVPALYGTGVLSRTTSATQMFWRVRLVIP